MLKRFIIDFDKVLNASFCYNLTELYLLVLFLINNLKHVTDKGLWFITSTSGILSYSRVLFFCFITWCSLYLAVKRFLTFNALSTRDINWVCLRFSGNLPSVFWISYVFPFYILCTGSKNVLIEVPRSIKHLSFKFMALIFTIDSYLLKQIGALSVYCFSCTTYSL